MAFTRIWKGFKEYQSHPYYQGQKRIMSGRKAGCYEAITGECRTREEAERLIQRVLEANSRSPKYVIIDEAMEWPEHEKTRP